jgi:hypothetical protein
LRDGPLLQKNLSTQFVFVLSWLSQKVKQKYENTDTFSTVDLKLYHQQTLMKF